MLGLLDASTPPMAVPSAALIDQQFDHAFVDKILTLFPAFPPIPSDQGLANIRPSNGKTASTLGRVSGLQGRVPRSNRTRINHRPIVPFHQNCANGDVTIRHRSLRRWRSQI